MDWGQMATLVGTVAATGVAVVGLVWRMLRDVRRDLGEKIEQVRPESREAHAKIGEQIAHPREGLQADIAKVRSDLGTEIGKVRSDLSTELGQLRDSVGTEITQLRDGMSAETAQVRDGLRADIAKLREGLAEVRGGLKGVTRALDTLREDFRAHVMAA